MRKIILLRRLWVCLGIVAMLIGFNLSAYARNLKASLPYIPLLSESPEKGAFVELVKAIDEVYMEGKISIEVYPFARSINNVVLGIADFHLPMVKTPDSIADKQFRFASQRMGVVCHVIYSHKDHPITRDQINDVHTSEKFPYIIDVVMGTPHIFNFPTVEIPKLEYSLRKLEAHRIDAFIAAQEEGDHIVNLLKAKFVHRSLLECRDDLIIIPKGSRGDEIDQIISEALRALKASGRLQEIRKKIHIDYQDWQPFNMDW